MQNQDFHLPPDLIPWLEIARKYDGADESTRKSLEIGLRGIGHPICEQALERLKGKKL